jgi:hypothetical protein
MLHMCVYMHSRFIENHPIRILEDEPLISEVVMSQWARDHYIPLQRFTMGHMPDLAKVVRGTIAMLRFSEVVRGTMTSLAPCGPERMTMPLPTHLSKTHFPQHP